MTMEIRHIVAPTDFSEFSLRAIKYAFGWAQKLRATLLLLHVVQLPAYPIDADTPADLITTVLKDLERDANDRLAQLLPEAEAAQVEVARHVVVGVPYEKILEAVQVERVDVIVMATHGRTGLSHLFLGSMAERIVRTAPCPVLTIRATA